MQLLVAALTEIMCLILFGYRMCSDQTLIVAANRDERFERASAAAHFWSDAPQVLGGRDLVSGGSWLGCTSQGRFAALTNFSGPQDPLTPRSRGGLIQDFLSSTVSAQAFAQQIDGSAYAGFNLLLFDTEELVYTSNKAPTEVLEPGFYGLSNAELGAPWPKCRRGARTLAQRTAESFATTDLIGLLHDTQVPPDDEFPQRGADLQFERTLAPSFIVGDVYGTRASTGVILGSEQIRFTEQSYLSGGVVGERVDFTIDRQ